MAGKGSAIDEESRVWMVTTILIAGSIVSTLVVFLRVFTRTRVLRSFGCEDAFIICAQVTIITEAIVIGLENEWGLGRHSWLQDEAEYIPYMKAFYASIIIYSVGMCFLKISVLLQYRRIFAVPMIQKLTLIGLVFEGCWAVTATFLLTFICVPVASFWDDSIEGKCINQLVVWYLNASINLVTDFMVFSLPLPVIKNLQLRKPQKWMLTGIFCLAFFGCIISILRLRTLSLAFETDDPTWDNVDAAIWSFLELSIGVTVSCLPMLRPLIARITPHIVASIRSRRSGGNAVYGTGAGSRNPYHFPYPHPHPHPHSRSQGGTELPAIRIWSAQSQSRTRTTVTSTTQMQIKNSDSTSDLFGSSDARSSENEEMMANGTYNVEVSAGGGGDDGRGNGVKSQGSIWSGGGRRSSPSSDEKRPSNNSNNTLGGITATTQITQEVRVMREPV